jgi:hypothetical protein
MRNDVTITRMVSNKLLHHHASRIQGYVVLTRQVLVLVFICVHLIQERATARWI